MRGWGKEKMVFPLLSPNPQFLYFSPAASFPLKGSFSSFSFPLFPSFSFCSPLPHLFFPGTISPPPGHSILHNIYPWSNDNKKYVVWKRIKECRFFKIFLSRARAHPLPCTPPIKHSMQHSPNHWNNNNNEKESCLKTHFKRVDFSKFSYPIPTQTRPFGPLGGCLNIFKILAYRKIMASQRNL